MEATSHERHHDSRFADRLERDWARLSRHRPSIRRAQRWAATDHPFEHLDQLLACAGYGLERSMRCTACHEPNDVVRRLLGVARADELAARIVLQRVLPGLRQRANRWSFGDFQPDSDGALGDLVGVAWLLIRSYDVEQRRGFAVANLVRDSAYYAFIAPKRRRSSGECPTDPLSMNDQQPAPESSPCTELAELLVEAHRAGVDRGELELVRHLAAGDGTTEALAERDHVTSRAIRYRRTRAIEHLRAFALHGIVDPQPSAA